MKRKRRKNRGRIGFNAERGIQNAELYECGMQSAECGIIKLKGENSEEKMFTVVRSLFTDTKAKAQREKTEGLK